MTAKKRSIKSTKKKVTKKNIKKKNHLFNRVNAAVFFFIVAVAGLGLFFQGFTTEAVPSVPFAYYRNQNIGRTNLQSTQQEIVKEKKYAYQFISKSKSPTIKIGEKTTLSLKLRNSSNVSWYSSEGGIVFLGTSHMDDRESVFFRSGARGWVGANRIRMDKMIVKPGEVATFTFEITAPSKSGIYREFFKPLVEGLKWLDDKNIYWDITVVDPSKKDEKLSITVSGRPIKYIKVKLSEQRLYAFENGIPKYTFITSTGLAGMDTPTGTFQIYNKFPVAYSKPYDLYMDNWMAFTASGSHGIHSLPYWALRNGGRLYEGEAHLGTPVSHGCIRVSLENSKLLYGWADVGTQVVIEN